MLNTRIKEYVYTYTYNLYGIEIWQPHNLYYYVGVHNMGRIALGNRKFKIVHFVYVLLQQHVFSPTHTQN